MSEILFLLPLLKQPGGHRRYSRRDKCTEVLCLPSTNKALCLPQVSCNDAVHRDPFGLSRPQEMAPGIQLQRHVPLIIPDFSE